jgi:protein arginine N-methyltransferase 5
MLRGRVCMLSAAFALYASNLSCLHILLLLDEAGSLLALASEWLELDSDVEGIRFDSELALKQEVAYAAHLHVQTLILPAPRNSAFVTDYARAVANLLSTPGYLHFSIRIPITDPDPDPLAPSAIPAGASKSFEAWNTIRSFCSYNPRLSVCLDLSTPLPPSSFYERWHAEPVRHLLLPASAYLANAKGYPVLSKVSQNFFKSMFKFKPTIILSGIEKGLHSSGGQEAYAL